MKVELLYFDGCPNASAARDLLKSVLEKQLNSYELSEVEVLNESESISMKFLGSPSIRINGKDIDPMARDDEPFFGCRIYHTGTGLKGLPSVEMIETAIKRSSL